MDRRLPGRSRPSERVDARWQVSPRNPDGSRRRSGPYLGPVKVTPTRVTLAVALGGSALYILYAVVNRDERQVPLLVSGAAVLGIVFTSLAIAGAMGSYRAGRDGESGRAVFLALGGGLAALAAFGCATLAVLLALLWRASTG